MKPWGLEDTDSDTINSSALLQSSKQYNTFKFRNFRLRTNKKTQNIKVFSNDLFFFFLVAVATKGEAKNKNYYLQNGR